MVTTAIQNGVAPASLRTVTEEVQRIIDAQLHEHGPPATGVERDGLLTFLIDHILPEFVESNL